MRSRLSFPRPTPAKEWIVTPPTLHELMPVVPVTKTPESDFKLRVGKGLKSDEADQQVQHAHKRARKEQPEEAPRFEEKLGGLTRKVGAMVHAPSVAVPLSEELTGNLRTLRTKSSVLKDQIDAKQFAIDPQLKLRTTMG